MSKAESNLKFMPLNINCRTQRPESSRESQQKVFRISFSSFKTKTKNEIDTMNSPSYTKDKAAKLFTDPAPVSSSENIKTEASKHNRKSSGSINNLIPTSPTSQLTGGKVRLIKIIRFNPNNTSNVKIDALTARNGFDNAATSRPVSPRTNGPSELIAIRPTHFNSKKALTSAYTRSFLKVPAVHELKKNEASPKNMKNTRQYILETSSKDNLNDRFDLRNFRYNDSSRGVDEDSSPTFSKLKRTNSTMELSRTVKGKINNSSSSQNTLIIAGDQDKTKNLYPRRDTDSIIIIDHKDHILHSNTPQTSFIKNDTYRVEKNAHEKCKNGKIISKFVEAKEKAEIYNDKMIKQFQFDKENEEEEINFLELCDVLQNHL